jgi:polyphosphate glucokinase
MSGHVLGIDIGGTGVKAAVVDTEQGILLTPKIKYATPKPSSPEAVMGVVNQLIDDCDWRGKPMGCGLPSIVKNNIVFSAANIDKSWMNVNLDDLFAKEVGQEATFINDADAAGIAEMTYGEGKGVDGTVIMLTLGTGIGSGLFRDQKLVPNTEFGHLEHKKSIWEHYASNSARERKDLSWSEWGAELNEYLNHLDLLLSPDLVILGGGVSKKFSKYKDYLNVSYEIVPASMLNNAGIIGAAMNASKNIFV